MERMDGFLPKGLESRALRRDRFGAANVDHSAAKDAKK
jgi:hypothetical protein